MPSSFKRWKREHPEYAEYRTTKKTKNYNYKIYNNVGAGNVGTSAGVGLGAGVAGAALVAGGLYAGGRYLYDKLGNALNNWLPQGEVIQPGEDHNPMNVYDDYEPTDNAAYFDTRQDSGPGSALSQAAQQIHQHAHNAVTPVIKDNYDFYGNQLVDPAYADDGDNFYDAAEGPESYAYSSYPDDGDWDQTSFWDVFGGWFN